MNRLQNCLHPLLVTNKYTGQKVVVRCGKCAVCRNSHAATWVQRLDQEAMQHKYVYFVTLQYDEQHVPQMVRLRPEDSEKLGYIDIETSEVIFLDDCPCDGIRRDASKEKQFVLDTKVLNVLNKRDFQLFIKQIRNELKRIDGVSPSFRYWLALEYGPQTFRPHGHLLCFFDSPLLAERFQEVCAKCWPYGNIYDPHPVSGSAAEYVASYVTCTTDLPKILLHSQIRPCALFSKRPIIGTYREGIESVRELFVNSSIQMRLQSSDGKTFVDVPLWRSLRDRLFPRLSRYNLLDDVTRRLLYLSHYGLYISTNGCFSEACRVVRDSVQRGFLNDSVYKRYIESICYDFNPSTGLREFHIDRVDRFLRITWQVYQNSVTFAIEPADCVTKILNFYEKLEKSHLREYFQFQEQYFENHPVSDWLLLDASFVRRVNGKNYSDCSRGEQFYLSLFGITDGMVNLTFEASADFKNMSTLHQKISFDNNKTKKSNDYLLAHKDKFGNIVKYKNI